MYYSCQYEALELHHEYAKNGHLLGVRVQSAGLCSNQPDKHTGWCEEHAYVFEMLQEAIAAGCPELTITTTYNRDTRKHEPALTVGKGLNSWEAYAPRHQRSRHDAVMSMLKEIKDRKDEANQKAVEMDVVRSRQNAAYFEAGCA